MRKEGAPRLSVLMCVYNAQDYLADAVQSVLDQTFRDFEFIVVNDGSTDGSAAILAAFSDERISIIDNPGNLGLIRSLNIGLDATGGELIARMDADDICVADRFEKQIAFLDNHPEVGVCGTWLAIIGGEEVYQFPLTHEEIKLALLEYNPVAHPSVLFRRSILGNPPARYDEGFPTAEDYELWSRLVFVTRFANLPETLLRYRKHDKQVTRQKMRQVNETAGKIKLGLLRSMGLTPDDDEKRLHLFLFNDQNKELRSNRLLCEADAWLNKLIAANGKLHQFDDDGLRAIWRSKLFVTCVERYDLRKWRILKKTLCYRTGGVSAGEKLKIFLKCLVRRKVG